MDVVAIEVGRDFRKAIDESVANCSVLLALIGQVWLETTDAAGQRRLEDPSDFVRIELASALRRDIPVVPVLVRGAKMPHVDRLPEDLKELAFRNAVELTHARWKSDVQVLIRALRPYIDVPNGTGIEGAQAEGVATGTSDSSKDLQTVAALEAEKLERVKKTLAGFIGPIAEIVVNRAAKRCTSMEELCGTVAREIEDDADRARFVKLCRS